MDRDRLLHQMQEAVERAQRARRFTLIPTGIGAGNGCRVQTGFEEDRGAAARYLFQNCEVQNYQAALIASSARSAGVMLWPQCGKVV